MCPCRLGTGNFRRATSSKVDKVCACFIEGIALAIELEPEFFEAVFRLINKESKRKSSSGLPSEKKPSICLDIVLN